nr:MAG TPA_asm: hypothetical protein [Caudoviricetes sp.]
MPVDTPMLSIKKFEVWATNEMLQKHDHARCFW